jgi:hypothetical protein
MTRTAYIPISDARRLMMRAIVEHLVAQGWDRAGILITEDDPMGNGVNGYRCEQGTTRAMLVTGLANDEGDA